MREIGQLLLLAVILFLWVAAFRRIYQKHPGSDGFVFFIGAFYLSGILAFFMPVVWLIEWWKGRTRKRASAAI